RGNPGRNAAGTAGQAGRRGAGGAVLVLRRSRFHHRRRPGSGWRAWHMSDGQGRRRVVITGMGAVTPCGLDAEQTWRSVREGRSGVSVVEGFEGNVRIAAQVRGFEPELYMEHRSVRKTDRFAQFAVAAATMAVQDAGIDIRADAERIGCSIGTGIGGLKTEEVAHRKLFEAGPDRLNPFWVTALIPKLGGAGYRR